MIAALLVAMVASPDAPLLRLLEEDLDAQMRRWPTWASARGDRRFDHLLPDLSPEAEAAWVEESRARLQKLRALDAGAFSEAGRVNAALLERELTERIERVRWKPWQLAVNQLGGPHTELLRLPERLSFEARERREAWRARLEAIPGYLAQLEANLRAGLAEGRTPPRAVMQGLVDPELAPLAIDEESEKVVSRVVAPAYRTFFAFLREEYVPNCRDTLAAYALPDGEAYYAWLLSQHTTVSFDAAAIHETGKTEVARIRAEMAAVIERTGFSGDFASFVKRLRTDPRFYFTSEEAILDGYRALAKRIDAELPRLFGRLPRLPYGVKAMAADLAPTAPTAYYYRGSAENGVPGWFVVNTHRLDQRPRYEMVPLCLHEAVPGHHLQIALAQEAEGVPEWRETLSYTAFVEGWALYAERLGLEMGLYDDPYDDFGRLSYEMWRAMRLVVDTGIHAFGWTRERAVAYMLENSALTEENVAREVDRYIAWPGQATAYKIGELEVRKLRARAEKAMGGRFDLRAFHDMLLAEGALPLDVLASRVDAWIDTR